jgi:hypothetical protein
MKKLLSLILILSVLVISCKNKKDGNEASTNETVVNDLSKDTTEIKEVVLGFYSWYHSNYEKMQQFKLAKGTRNIDEPPYAIDWAEVDRLHQLIRSSVPQLGEEYLKNQRVFFQQSDSAFKVDLDDDIPYGFDYDWYTNSQEDPQYLLDELKRASKWNITVNGNTALVDIKGIINDPYINDGKPHEVTVLNLEMIREAGKWKIAWIGAK